VCVIRTGHAVTTATNNVVARPVGAHWLVMEEEGGGRGEQEGSKGGALVKTSSGVAHREALASVGWRKSSRAAVFLPVMTLGCLAAMSYDTWESRWR
jgi:hypothetical protein